MKGNIANTSDMTPHNFVDWLLRTTNEMVRCRDIPVLLDLAYSAIRDGLGYDRVGLILLDRERMQLVEHIGTDAHGQKFYPRRVNLLSRRYYETILSDPRMGLGGAGFMLLEDAFREAPPEYRQ